MKSDFDVFFVGGNFSLAYILCQTSWAPADCVCEIEQLRFWMSENEPIATFICELKIFENAVFSFKGPWD